MITVPKGSQDVDRAEALTRYQAKQIKQRQKPPSKNHIKSSKQNKEKDEEDDTKGHKQQVKSGGVMWTYKHQEG